MPTTTQDAIVELTSWLDGLIQEHPDPHSLSLPRLNRMTETGTDPYRALIDTRPHLGQRMLARTWMHVISEMFGVDEPAKIAKILVEKGYYKQEA